MKPNQKIKYFVYARKSTEGEERQALSIDTQKDKAKELFGHLDIVEVLEERQSAFEPLTKPRPVFLSMIERIKNGEAQGIISWHPDRLSRNEIDAATVTYMIRTGTLVDLKFGSYNFDNSPEGIMMLQLAMSQSQYFSSKLSKDVKRGIEKKLKLGQRPGLPPQGYMNDVVTKEIVPDPERFEMVQRMWRMLLTGLYTPPQILKIATEEWGYTTRKFKKIGGGAMAKSGIYKMFTNPFYAGRLIHNGEDYDGSHVAMITLEEFDYAQTLLGNKGKPRQTKHDFSYTGMIRCGECGCLITGKTTPKFIKGTGKVFIYEHYRCTLRSQKRPCTQRKYKSLTNLEIDIENEIDKYEILPHFRDIALRHIAKKHAKEVAERSQIYESQHRKLVSAQKDLDGLIDMKLRGQLDDDEYATKREQLKAAVARLQELQDDTEHRADIWFNTADRLLRFATYARGNFLFGDKNLKKEIFATLGQNFTLKDGKLTVQPVEWLVPIADRYHEVEAEYEKVRTEENLSGKAKTAALSAVSTTWLGR